jgi:hypothetical protein
MTVAHIFALLAISGGSFGFGWGFCMLWMSSGEHRYAPRLSDLDQETVDHARAVQIARKWKERADAK